VSLPSATCGSLFATVVIGDQSCVATLLEAARSAFTATVMLTRFALSVIGSEDFATSVGA
jgi:hypothetical protein